jgi:hypothetical protein
LLDEAPDHLAHEDKGRSGERGDWTEAAGEADSKDQWYPDPGPRQAGAQRTSDSALDGRQGKQVQGHTTAQDPADPRPERRLATLQDGVFDTGPGCGQDDLVIDYSLDPEPGQRPNRLTLAALPAGPASGPVEGGPAAFARSSWWLP